MHKPSAMTGDIAVKNWGTLFDKFSLRHITLPVPASRHERTPPTPSVTTFPSATAGELLGPGCLPAGPVGAWAGAAPPVGFVRLALAPGEQRLAAMPFHAADAAVDKVPLA